MLQRVLQTSLYRQPIYSGLLEWCTCPIRLRASLQVFAVLASFTQVDSSTNGLQSGQYDCSNFASSSVFAMH